MTVSPQEHEEYEGFSEEQEPLGYIYNAFYDIILYCTMSNITLRSRLVFPHRFARFFRPH